MSDFTARMAQDQLKKVDNEALADRLADTSIALAMRIGVTPQQVLRDAVEACAFSEDQWWSSVKPHIESWDAA